MRHTSQHASQGHGCVTRLAFQFESYCTSGPSQGLSHYTLNPKSYTLRPTPYTLHPIPYTLNPIPYTL